MTTTTEQTTTDVEPRSIVVAAEPVVNVPALNQIEVKIPSDVDDLIKAETLPINEITGTGRLTKAKITKIICGSSIGIITLGILSIFPVLQLIVGWRYADECPISWRIPRYLIVSGVLGLLAIVLSIVLGFFSLFTKKKLGVNQSSTTTVLAYSCGVCSISIIVLFLVIFLFGWFIAGCIWIFGRWNTVQYRYPDQADYCHPLLYRFACILLIISLIYQIINCGRSFSQMTKVMKTKRNNSAIPVPTTEP